VTKSSKLSSVDNVPSHHSVAQGRDVAGCKRSGAAAKAGWLCSWLRTGSSCPWGAVNWWIMLASLIGWHCVTASGPWRCASGPPVSAGPGSGVRPPPSHRGWSSSSSVCLHCVLCTCVCQCIGEFIFKSTRTNITKLTPNQQCPCHSDVSQLGSGAGQRGSQA
jgi:hypothetical protein